jgi:hypothetical protein
MRGGGGDVMFEFGFGLSQMSCLWAGGSAPAWTQSSVLYVDFTRSEYFLAKYKDRALSADFTNNTYFMKGGAS